MGIWPASAACLYRASLFTPSEVERPRRAASFFLVVAGLQTGAFVLIGRSTAAPFLFCDKLSPWPRKSKRSLPA